MFNKGSNNMTNEHAEVSRFEEANPKWKLLTRPAPNDTFQAVWEVSFLTLLSIYKILIVKASEQYSTLEYFWKRNSETR